MIDINKKYQYRNGEPARILCTDRKHDNCPVISMSEEGLLFVHDSEGLIDGSMYNHFYDLIEVKEKKILWLNVYDDSIMCSAYFTKPESDRFSMSDRKARIKVEYCEGQFDE